jgi:hypothetical protein
MGFRTPDYVKAYCKDAGMRLLPTDKELAVLAGRVECSTWHLYKCLTGRLSPSVDLAVRLQDVTRGAIPAAKLLGIPEAEK